MFGCVCECARARAGVCVRASVSVACLRMHVCVCHVKTSENSSFCISGITRPIELKFGVSLKQMQRLLSYQFRWLIHGFYNDSNFSKKVCNRSSCCKFQTIELNSYLKRDQCSRTFEIGFGKTLSKHSNFIPFWIKKKAQIRSKFHKIQVFSQIVFCDCV